MSWKSSLTGILFLQRLPGFVVHVWRTRCGWNIIFVTLLFSAVEKIRWGPDFLFRRQFILIAFEGCCFKTFKDVYPALVDENLKLLERGLEVVQLMLVVLSGWEQRSCTRPGKQVNLQRYWIKQTPKTKPREIVLKSCLRHVVNYLVRHWSAYH